MIKIFLGAIIAVLFISNITTAYFLYKNSYFRGIVKPTSEINNRPIPPDSTFVSATSVPATDNDSGEIPTSTEANEMTVNWNEWPVNVGGWMFAEKARLAIDVYNKKYNSNMDADAFIKGLKVSKLGIIKTGVYAEADMYAVNYREEGPVTRDNFYRVIDSGGKLILLSGYSDKPYEPFSDMVTEDQGSIISNIETPRTLAIPGSNLKLIRSKVEPFRWMTDYDNPKRMFDYEGGNYVYQEENGSCLITRAQDGSAREYSFDLPFASSTIDTYSGLETNRAILSLSWSDGTRNDKEFVLNILSGCGPRGCYNYPPFLKKENLTVNIDELLKETGKTSSGDPIFEFKNRNSILKYSTTDDGITVDKFYQDMYAMYFPGVDETGNMTKDKISYEAFLKVHPVIFWRDPFGRFIQFTKTDFMPAVECGKPVIYLYPTVKQDISVNVYPTGGFSLTEPYYGNGWNVSAEPDGKIFNYADRKNYPYLFWEGKGLNYTRPAEGFVVKKENVETFLEQTLAKLGLEEKEYHEFIDFWLPKMQDRNYYFITFLPKEQFDTLAPLRVMPHPDAVIRVFMDYQGLDEQISVKEQKITTPKREGFTVVEWGGALHK